MIVAEFLITVLGAISSGLLALVVAWRIFPSKSLKWLWCDILGWHRPTSDRYSDGCSEHSKCRICGRDIMQDSQGNWY